jgi:nicotinamide-nucleotide amidase
MERIPMLPQDIEATAESVIRRAIEAGLMIATAESCTGGLVAGALTAIAGSSAVVDRGFVTYSNEAKTEMLGVSQDVLARFGAVSEPTARAMAEGAITHSRAQAAVSITGIAGPGGGSDEKPVGLVHFAVTAADGTIIHVEKRFGAAGRDKVRLESVRVALSLLLEVVSR